MYHQKAISKKTLKVTTQHNRIRIRYSEVRIRGSGSVPKCHGSATLQTRLAGSDSHEFISFPGPTKGHESGSDLRGIFLYFKVKWICSDTVRLLFLITVFYVLII
jgi:hypothetical protein